MLVYYWQAIWLNSCHAQRLVTQFEHNVKPYGSKHIQICAESKHLGQVTHVI